MAKAPKKTVSTAPGKPKKAAPKAAPAKSPKATAQVAEKAAKPTKATRSTATAKKPTAKKPKPKATAEPKRKAPKPKTAPRATVPLDSVSFSGTLADPQITSPAAGASVTAGVNLAVGVTTNRGDLGYVVTLQDLTTTPPPSVVPFSAAAPAGTTFTVTIGGSNLVAGRSYNIQVALDPASGATPPNLSDAVTVNT
ncbi:hypothetical protein [Frigoriglobus tundricola]|uniref:Uncharacterized protein n=1 Tax=Frigoriglobus tundricola TaxID=2774151 RepID=A0A6M5YFY2_9BACT|nr:hypothetical protein [Frigoriglobus tundricola]QJW92915.1 hypothetical protein FTUN_0412 [Frigoriglobus tundricola]